MNGLTTFTARSPRLDYRPYFGVCANNSDVWARFRRTVLAFNLRVNEIELSNTPIECDGE